MLKTNDINSEKINKKISLRKAKELDDNFVLETIDGIYLPKWLLKDNNLTTGAKKLLALIMEICCKSPDNACTLSNKAFCTFLYQSLQATTTQLYLLTKNKYIKREAVSEGSIIRRITVNPVKLG